MVEEYQSRGRTGPEKAVNFGTYAKQYGWGGKWLMDEGTGVTHLHAYRGDNETIDIWWDAKGRVTQEALPLYVIAGEKIKCRNVSAAADIVAKEPDMTRLQKATRKQRRASGGNVEVKATYDFEDMTDDEIEQALLGRTIGWVNTLSGEVDQAEVLGRKTIKVTRSSLGDEESEVKPQVHFTDSSGFHAVYLHAIVSVS